MTTKVPIELSSTPSINDGGNATAITIDSSERVGIGETSPSAPLTVNTGSDGNNVYIDNNGTQLAIGSTSSVNYINTQNGGATLAIQTNGTERMRINSDGDIGINTTSPISGSKLDVVDTDDMTMRVRSTGASSSAIRYQNSTTGTTTSDGLFVGIDATTNGYVWNYENLPILFGTNNTERMRIDSSGRLLVGNTTFSNIDNASSTGSAFETGRGRMSVTAGSNVFEFNTVGNGNVGFIQCSSSATTYSTSSDYRLKENIRPLENGLERLNQLNPVKFDWKKTGISSEGFIAHEVDEIFGDAVSGKKDGKAMQGMDYGRITPLLVKAIQELSSTVDELKTEIKTLKGE